MSNHRTHRPEFKARDATAVIRGSKTVQEIEGRMTARAFGTVHNPKQGPKVRRFLQELMEVIDRTSPDGVI
ncbi:hypothetical protein [Synechococcus sp. CCY 0621]|uniref:hypothetical protein n=1 Tax=Synechococcus sp. CCY 0621 TaxID=2815603 RepID=UPI001C22EE55|nr:hypothetical protein [Synechococcus sp. CCY 0621]